MSISYDIERLLSYAEINLLMDEADKVYVRNVLMQKIGLTEWENSEVDEDELETVTLDELLDPLYAYAEKTAVRPIEKSLSQRLWTSFRLDRER